jgi:protein phosphatase
MGGHQAGEVASSLAVQAVVARFGGKDATLLPSSGNGYADQLRSVVEQANSEIVSQGTDERRGMGTTLTLGLISGGTLYLGHVGDSRAYLFSKGSLRPLTNDHSWVAEEVRAGRMTAEEAVNHPRRNLVTRALGADVSVQVDTDSMELLPGDVVLIASDGLHGVVTDDEIADTLRSSDGLQVVTQRLVDLANERGGPDNVTVVTAALQLEGADFSTAGELAIGGAATIVPGARSATPGRKRRWHRLWLA